MRVETLLIISLAMLAFTISPIITTPVQAEIGAEAPNFLYLNQEGKDRSFYDFATIDTGPDREKPAGANYLVLVQFISLECPWCSKMIDDMKIVQPEYDEVTYLTMDVNPSHFSGDISQYRLAKIAKWEFGVDFTGFNEEFGVNGVPSSYLVNYKGTIMKVLRGYQDKNDLRRSFNTTLEQLESDYGPPDDNSGEVRFWQVTTLVFGTVAVVSISIAFIVNMKRNKMISEMRTKRKRSVDQIDTKKGKKRKRR